MKTYRAEKSKKKNYAIAICLLLTVVMVVGGTLAYLFANTVPVENTFQPAKVGNHIDETLSGVVGSVMEKTNVRVQNSIKGNVDPEIVDAYIRATYTVTWQKTVNGVKYVLPAQADEYEVILNLDNSASGDVEGTWVKNGNYYYFTGIVAPGNSTDVLIKAVAPVVDAPEGYTTADGYGLNVEIISQSIQAEGTAANGDTPAKIAWGVDPSTLN